jgi:hypothetical protein
VDWIVRRHDDYDLSELSLFLAVQIVDRSLAKHWVPSQEMRKLGAAALMVASKFEDELFPEHDGLATLSDGHFKAAQLELAEMHLLMQLEYRLHDPTVGHHLHWFVKLCHGGRSAKAYAENDDQLSLATYLAELGLYCAEHSNWKPTQHAAAAVFLSNVLLSRTSWPHAFEVIVVGGQEPKREAIRAVAAELLRALGRSSPGQAVYDKHEDGDGISSQAIRWATASMGPNWRPNDDGRRISCNIS